MDSNTLRLIGFTAIGVGMAWVCQVFATGKQVASTGQLMWMLAAAVISGAGAGTIYAAASLREAAAVRVRS
jgi:hypothetical protein